MQRNARWSRKIKAQQFNEGGYGNFEQRRCAVAHPTRVISILKFSLGTIVMNTSRAGGRGQPCQRNDGAYDDKDHGGWLRVKCREIEAG